MANAYLSDLLAQSSALQATLDSLGKSAPLTIIRNQLVSGKYQHLVLTGMGSSFHGLYPLQLRLLSSLMNVVHIETSELIHFASELVNPTSLVVAVSQSGESAEVVQLLELTRNRVTLIGVTNTPRSALAENASQVILTCAGEEASVSCKTYISALAALAWLGDELLGERTYFPALAGVPDKVAEYWSAWQDAVEILKKKIADADHIFLLGRGNSLAAAYTGGLVIKEAARVAAEGMSSAAFRHGPLELVSPHTFAMIYLGAGRTTALNARLAQDICSIGGMAETVGVGSGKPPFQLPVCSPTALPILEILPAQLLSLALADLHSSQAGHFLHISKVTVTE